MKSYMEPVSTELLRVITEIERTEIDSIAMHSFRNDIISKVTDSINSIVADYIKEHREEILTGLSADVIQKQVSAALVDRLVWEAANRIVKQGIA